MEGTIGLDYRKQANEFIREHEDILDSQSAAKVAVLYSRSSRDFIDRGAGEGYDQSEAPYLELYRTTLAALTRAHVQFNILVLEEARPDLLAAYEVLVAPSLGAVSDQSHGLLTGFPGLVLVVGSYGTMNEYGDLRAGKLQLGESVESTVEDLPRRLGAHASKVKASERLIIEEKVTDTGRVTFILNPLALEEEIRVEDGEWDLVSFGLPNRVVTSPSSFEAPTHFAVLVEKKPSSTAITEREPSHTSTSESIAPTSTQPMPEGFVAALVPISGATLVLLLLRRKRSKRV
jgi:hypothetical protein